MGERHVACSNFKKILILGIGYQSQCILHSRYNSSIVTIDTIKNTFSLISNMIRCISFDYWFRCIYKIVWKYLPLRKKKKKHDSHLHVALNVILWVSFLLGLNLMMDWCWWLSCECKTIFHWFAYVQVGTTGASCSKETYIFISNSHNVPIYR